MIHETALDAKVAAVNSANGEANRIGGLLAEALRPFVGQKVVTATGELTAKVKKVLPEFPRNVSLSVYQNHSSYFLAWTAKACQSYAGNRFVDQFATYYEATAYIANIRDGVLAEIREQTERRTDHNAEAVIEARQAVQEAKALLSKAEAGLYPFGGYDR